MDEDYLKMILALPDEFFEGWEFNDGDQVYLIEEIDDYSPSKDHGLYTVFDGLLANDGFLNTENWLYVRAIDFKNARPILSQEQLQEMLVRFHIVNNEFSRKRSILHIMGHWADYLMRKHDFEYEKIQRYEDYENLGDPESFETLMLKFTVSTILMLSWDGEAWL